MTVELGLDFQVRVKVTLVLIDLRELIRNHREDEIHENDGSHDHVAHNSHETQVVVMHQIHHDIRMVRSGQEHKHLEQALHRVPAPNIPVPPLRLAIRMQGQEVPYVALEVFKGGLPERARSPRRDELKLLKQESKDKKME